MAWVLLQAYDNTAGHQLAAAGGNQWRMCGWYKRKRSNVAAQPSVSCGVMANAALIVAAWRHDSCGAALSTNDGGV